MNKNRSRKIMIEIEVCLHYRVAVVNQRYISCISITQILNHSPNIRICTYSVSTNKVGKQQ